MALSLLIAFLAGAFAVAGIIFFHIGYQNGYASGKSESEPSNESDAARDDVIEGLNNIIFYRE